MLPTITDPQTRRKSRHTHLSDHRPGPYRYRDAVRKRTAEDPRPVARAERCATPRDTIKPPPTPPELLAALPAWSSRANYLAVVHELAELPEVKAACTQRGVARDVWLEVVINDALNADTDTGHNMITTQDTAAHRLGRRAKQVQRARRVSQDLGIMVEVYRGYTLSYDQRMDLFATDPHHPQRGVANSYAMVLCPPRQRARIARIPANVGAVFAQVYANVHLPTFGGLSPLSHLLETISIRPANAVRETEPPSAAQPRRRRCLGTSLAHEILAHPGMALFQDVRAGRLAPQLGPHQAGGWHGLDLGEALLKEATLRGIQITSPAIRPWGLLKTLLASIDPVYEVYANTEPAQQPPAEPEPCGLPPCDGHGWINLPGAAAKCPHCPPTIRGRSPFLEADWSEPGPLDEPPF